MELIDGVSIVGGYDSNWLYSPEDQKPTISDGNTQSANTNTFILRAENISTPLTLAHLKIAPL